MSCFLVIITLYFACGEKNLGVKYLKISKQYGVINVLQRY